MKLLPILRALISVYDKSGIIEFAQQLRKWNIEIISSGGTLKALRDAGLAATSISDVTGFPEILNGRVKTLHPKIHAAILAVSDNAEHKQQLDEYAITPIDMIVVNLYPFEQTVSKDYISIDDAIEVIDIGGSALLRAAAKNFQFKTVIVDPTLYPLILSELEQNDGSITEGTRLKLAKEAFSHTARYDAIISNYLSQLNGTASESPFPETLTLSHKKVIDLRYGENPHQRGALYGNFFDYFKQLHGKMLSYNNIIDIQSAAEVLEEFLDPTVVIIKHTNPCGVGSAKVLSEAYQKALTTDPKSAYGGIVAVNRPIDLPTAQLIDKVFTEVVIAPDFIEGTLDHLTRKKDRRLIQQCLPLRPHAKFSMKQVAGGMLLQTQDTQDIIPEKLNLVTRRKPTDDEHAAMRFAWRVAKHVKSNSIVYANPDRTIGIGAGQMSRLDSSRVAIMKAREAGLELKGTAVASDGFFPFADGLLEAIEAGATAVIQPGGSIRDGEVIEAADNHNITMAFTQTRHFKH